MLPRVQTFILTWDGSDTGYPPGEYEADIKRRPRLAR